MVSTLALALLLTGAPLESGTQLTYRGTLYPRDASATADTTKEFEVTVLVGESDAAQTNLYWMVSEKNLGRWPWIERFGHLVLNQAGRPASETSTAAVLYDYGTGTTVVPLLPPVFIAPEKLAVGAKWKSGDNEVAVAKETEYQDRETWQISVRNPVGRNRTLWVDKNSPLVVGYEARHFFNMGTEHAVELRLEKSEQLTEVQWQAHVAGFKALVELRSKLNRRPRTIEGDWKPEQLEILSQSLPAIGEAIPKETKLAKLANAGRLDLQTQNNRENAVENLAQEFTGSDAPTFELPLADGGKLSNEDLKGKVTVLHFWEYRDSPLEEPYGQVGYLDFLWNKRKGDGVKVLGVAVNRDFSDPNKQDAAVRSAKKLKSFMRLSYPLAHDSGTVLGKFGDPRRVGAKLPLYVVIGPQGKVTHYHVGHYKVHPDRGLAELDVRIRQAASKQK